MALMIRPRTWLLVALLLLLQICVAAPVGAEEEPDEEAEDADAKLVEATDAQVKPWAAALKKAYKKKKESEITPALEAIDGFTHPALEKPLLKLMTHKLGSVAAQATELLSARCNEKLIKKMWKNAFSNKANAKRFMIRALVIRAVGRHGQRLDKKQYKELERDWRWMFGNPQKHFADPALALVEYFIASKDKRHCRKLAEQLDEPVATDPGSATNPPAEWWERRWGMWQPVKPKVVEALEAITGQEFDGTEEAKAWFEANKKTFKFDW